MTYSLLTPGVTPESFGSGMVGGLGGLLGRWGDSMQRGLAGGMQLGTALTNYGSNQRLAGMRETGALQKMQTDLLGNQNGMLEQQVAQQKLACTRIGWNSEYCQNVKAKLEGRQTSGMQAGGAGNSNAMTSGSAGPLSGGFGPSAVTGNSMDDAYPYGPQEQTAQDWY
jgi:hypothetical protein